jgi:hypothetical protein
MSYEEPKCGDECKLVEMLANKTPKEQSMENAIVAVQIDKMSEYAAAKLFKVNRQTLRNRLNKNVVAAKVSIDDVPSESAPAKPKRADKAERDQWCVDHEAGESLKAIASKYGRGDKTISKEINSRKSGESKPEATERPPLDDQPVTPTGKLNDHMKILVKREGKSSVLRLKIVEILAEMKIPMLDTMQAASKDHKRGPGIVRTNIQAAERQLAKDGQPGIQESLERVRKEARDIWKYADESLRLLQLQESFTELK